MNLGNQDPLSKWIVPHDEKDYKEYVEPMYDNPRNFNIIFDPEIDIYLNRQMSIKN